MIVHRTSSVPAFTIANRILIMWRNGADTMAIAKRLGVPESEVYNVLAKRGRR